MKRALRYLLLATSLFVVGCNSTAKSVENSVEPASSIELSSESISSSSPVPSFIKNSPWGEEAALASYETIGTIVPYFEADAFSYEVTTDDFGDPAIWFYLYFDTQETAESKLTDYAYAAWEQEGYECVIKPTRFQDPDTYSTFEMNVLYADLELDDNQAVEIQGLASQKVYNDTKMGCLGLFCFNYIPNSDPSRFPTYAAESIIGKNNDLPVLVGDDLTFNFAFFMYDGHKCLEIQVTSKTTNYEIEEEYFNQLLDNNFFIEQYSDYDQAFTKVEFYRTGTYPEYDDSICYYAYPYSSDYIVYFDYDLYNQVFYIDILDI